MADPVWALNYINTLFNESCDRLLVDMVFFGITVTSTLVGVFFNALLPTIDVCAIIQISGWLRQYFLDNQRLLDHPWSRG